MSKKIKYTRGPIDEIDDKDLVKVDKSFLPPPEVIAQMMQRIKITISLSADSIQYFRDEAEKHGMQYQVLIRKVLDEYVAHQKRTDPD